MNNPLSRKLISLIYPLTPKFCWKKYPLTPKFAAIYAKNQRNLFFRDFVGL